MQSEVMDHRTSLAVTKWNHVNSAIQQHCGATELDIRRGHKHGFASGSIH